VPAGWPSSAQRWTAADDLPTGPDGAGAGGAAGLGGLSGSGGAGTAGLRARAGGAPGVGGSPGTGRQQSRHRRHDRERRCDGTGGATGAAGTVGVGGRTGTGGATWRRRLWRRRAVQFRDLESRWASSGNWTGVGPPRRSGSRASRRSAERWSTRRSTPAKDHLRARRALSAAPPPLPIRRQHRYLSRLPARQRDGFVKWIQPYIQDATTPRPVQGRIQEHLLDLRAWTP